MVPLGILTKFVVLNFFGGYSNKELDIQHSHFFSWWEAAEIRCFMALVRNWISTLCLFFFRFDDNIVWQRCGSNCDWHYSMQYASHCIFVLK